MRQEHSSAIPPTDWLGKWAASITDYSISAISLEGRVLTWNPGEKLSTDTDPTKSSDNR
ncbi:hypothetical protein HDE76_000355 [Rhodanobacter sp. ANJX3]|nr:hypothetical protein [Rhodanobacter sp. ANJX3]